MRLHNEKFIWTPGEYVAELIVETEPSAATHLRRYRFTLYESDSAELARYKDDYKYGGGITYDFGRHPGLFVPLLEHKG